MATREEDTSSRGDTQDEARPGMAEVHAAWLAAGASGDAATMQQLKSLFPEWLDLQRRVVPAPSMCSQFGSWNGFHLHTMGASALHAAVWEGQLDVIQFILEAGESPDTSADNGLTPTMMAIMHLSLMTMRCVFRDGVAVRRNLVVDCRHLVEEGVKLAIATVKLLLSFGADVDAQDQTGKTALHCSTSDDVYEVAKFLLDAGARIDEQDKNGKTPLHYCIQEGGLLVTNLLLSTGANVDATDTHGVSPLVLMLQRGDLNVLQLFLNHHQWVASPQRLDFASSVLLLAVDNERGEVVRYVVENGYASVKTGNSQGETPLHRAIVRRNPSLVQLVVGLDPEGDNLVAVTAELQTPAHYAARFGSVRVVELLLSAMTGVLGGLRTLGDANPLNATDLEGRTCLYIAGVLSNTERAGRMDRHARVQLLLEHGARLFSPTYLARELALSPPASSSPTLLLPAQVAYCLQRWLIESGSVDGDGVHPGNKPLTQLFVQWIASTPYSGPSAMVLTVVASAGYGQELLPLLLDLPLRRDAFRALLGRLGTLARCQRGRVLLLQLYNELQADWDSLVME
ncbi:hypothetical protein PHYPSEUDO_014560 [Phytophthora pseudosyringae]|uniref:Uncharacterized protein n=1 Tax=Phytophthora pseudosyringae TaxID=221518 RepID=A0A8T1V6Z5_9STRA|nr:hypothetical protein PHYPSEUDO_014560 [Phytophthora pseudosyringae]